MTLMKIHMKKIKMKTSTHFYKIMKELNKIKIKNSKKMKNKISIKKMINQKRSNQIHMNKIKIMLKIKK